MNVYARFDLDETLKKKQNIANRRAHRQMDNLKTQFAGGINIEMTIAYANILEF